MNHHAKSAPTKTPRSWSLFNAQILAKICSIQTCPLLLKIKRKIRNIRIILHEVKIKVEGLEADIIAVIIIFQYPLLFKKLAGLVVIVCGLVKSLLPNRTVM